MKKLSLLALMLMLSVVTVACMEPKTDTEEAGETDAVMNEDNAMGTEGEEAVADEIFQQIQAEIQAAAEANAEVINVNVEEAMEEASEALENAEGEVAEAMEDAVEMIEGTTVEGTGTVATGSDNTNN